MHGLPCMQDAARVLRANAFCLYSASCILRVNEEVGRGRVCACAGRARFAFVASMLSLTCVRGKCRQPYSEVR